MNKICLWFLLSCKRQLKHPAFMAFLILLPLLLLGMGKLERQDQEGIPVALYVEDQGVSFEIAQTLVANTDGAFHFYLCENQEEMINDVAARRAECGYLFYEGLKEKLDNKRLKRCIGIYSAPSTVTASLSEEVVFSAVMEVYGRDLLEDFTKNDPLFSGLNPDTSWKQMEPLYDQYYKNGSTFSFSYETAAGKAINSQKVTAAFPVRGLVAVYIFVIGLFSAVTLCSDEKKGLFIPVPSDSKLWCALASMTAPIILAALSGLAAIAVTGYLGSIWKELIGMAAYVAVVAVVSYVLKRIIPNPLMLCSLIPLLAMASLILCPVFFNIGAWVPALRILARCLPPYYYMTGIFT